MRPRRCTGAGPTDSHPTADYAAVAEFDDLAGNDFVIDPGRYLSLAPAAPDLDRAAARPSPNSSSALRP